MDSIRSLHLMVKAWLLDGPLAPYIEADLTMKEKALSRLQDPGGVARRFRVDDSLPDVLKCL